VRPVGGASMCINSAGLPSHDTRLLRTLEIVGPLKMGALKPRK